MGRVGATEFAKIIVPAPKKNPANGLKPYGLIGNRVLPAIFPIIIPSHMQSLIKPIYRPPNGLAAGEAKHEIASARERVTDY